MGEHGGERRGARPLDDQFFDFGGELHRVLDIAFADQQDVGDQRLDRRPGEGPRALDRDALGDGVAVAGRAFPLQRPGHRWTQLGLDADHLDLRLDRPRRRGAARDQAAAADGHHQHLEPGHLVQHLQRHRALAGDDMGVVVGMDEDAPLPSAPIRREAGGLGQAVAVQHHRRAEALGVGDLVERRRARHHDGRRDAECGGVKGDRLGVVARRHGDDAGAPFRRAQRQQLVERATLLERRGVLQVLQLEEQPRAADLGQGARMHARRVHDAACDGGGGGADVFNRDRHGGSVGQFGGAVERCVPAAMRWVNIYELWY